MPCTRTTPADWAIASSGMLEWNDGGTFSHRVRTRGLRRLRRLRRWLAGLRAGIDTRPCPFEGESRHGYGARWEPHEPGVERDSWTDQRPARDNTIDDPVKSAKPPSPVQTGGASNLRSWMQAEVAHRSATRVGGPRRHERATVGRPISQFKFHRLFFSRTIPRL